jgi:hypothetical protein
VVTVEPIRDNLRPRLTTGRDAGVQALYTRLQLACPASRRISYARARDCATVSLTNVGWHERRPAARALARQRRRPLVRRCSGMSRTKTGERLPYLLGELRAPRVLERLERCRRPDVADEEALELRRVGHRHGMESWDHKRRLPSSCVRPSACRERRSAVEGLRLHLAARGSGR